MIYDIIAGQSKSIPIAVYGATPVTVNGQSVIVAKVAPVIAASDFLISINGSGWQMFTNLPVVTPPGSEQIVVTLSAAETASAGAGGYITLSAYDIDQTSDWDCHHSNRCDEQAIHLVAERL